MTADYTDWLDVGTRLHNLRELADSHARWQTGETASRVERDRAIVAAHTEGHTHHAIAEATGLTRGRVGQIVNARKDKP